MIILQWWFNGSTSASSWWECFWSVVIAITEDIDIKSLFSFGHCPKRGVGFTHARIFWHFFYKVIAPKISKYLLKNHIICMFFGHFFSHHFYHYYYQYHNYHFNYYHHHWYFIPSCAQISFLTSRGKMTKLPELGGGDARKKTNVFYWCLP